MADYNKSNSELFGEFMKQMNEAGSISQPANSQPIKKVSLNTPSFNTPTPISTGTIHTAPEVTPLPQPTTNDAFEEESRRIQMEIKRLREEINSAGNSEQAFIENLRNRGDIIAFLCNAMEYVDGDTFYMGNDDSDWLSAMPSHMVRLSSFYCMKYPIPNFLWLAVGEGAAINNPDFTPARINSIAEDFQIFLSRINAITGLEFDLISEAQWEFIAKAGHDNYYKYSCNDRLNDEGQVGADNLGRPNSWGFYGFNYVRRTNNGWYVGLAEWCKDMLGVYPEDSWDILEDPVNTIGRERCFRSSDQPVYVRNNGLNKLNGQWREAIWTARLVCKATYEASDFISSHQTR